MSLVEERIEATLDANGQLQLSHQPHLPPGPVWVTIHAADTGKPRRGLADVIREIAAEQRARGFLGRSAADLTSDEEEIQAEDSEHDRELDAAHREEYRERP